MGESAVPANWDPYTQEGGDYLEIKKEMDSSSMKQHLRTSYVNYWTLTYQALPTVADEASTSLPPMADSEATPVSPMGDSEVARMPIAIGF